MGNRKSNDALNQIIEAWRKIADFDSLNYPDRLALEMPRFIDYAWDDFDAKQMFSVLLSSKSTYNALKPILFSGLCAWVVCPERKQLRQQGMLLIGVEQLQRAEALGQAAVKDRDVPNHELLGDIIGRLRGLGPDFYSDFYYPIGGLPRITRSAIPSQFKKNVAAVTEDLPIVVAMMQVFDIHAKYLNDSKLYYKASDSKGIEVVRHIYGEEREEIGIDLGKIESVWKLSRETVALIYAASTIAVTQRRNLLDTICAGSASYEKHGHLLSTWIKRARYAAETILGNSTKPAVGQLNADYLPDLEAEPTPEPNFTAAELSYIKGEFDIAAILGSRRPKERRQRLSRRGPRKA